MSLDNVYAYSLLNSIRNCKNEIYKATGTIPGRIELNDISECNLFGIWVEGTMIYGNASQINALNIATGKYLVNDNKVEKLAAEIT